MRVQTAGVAIKMNITEFLHISQHKQGSQGQEKSPSDPV